MSRRRKLVFEIGPSPSIPILTSDRVSQIKIEKQEIISMPSPMKLNSESGTLTCKVCGSSHAVQYVEGKVRKNGQPVIKFGLQRCQNPDCPTTQKVDGKVVGYYPTRSSVRAAAHKAKLAAIGSPTTVEELATAGSPTQPV